MRTPAAPPPRSAGAPRARCRAGGLAEATARVRLGAATDTAPDLLPALAGDPSVIVRAAVAMKRRAEQADRSWRATATSACARCLAAGWPLLPYLKLDRARPSALARRGATLPTLVEDETERVRATIAEVVKEMPSAPRELILRLAHDSAVPVCEPVIRLSPLLAADGPAGAAGRAAGTGDRDCIAAGRPSRSPMRSRRRRTRGDRGAAGEPPAAIREATLDALIARAAVEGMARAAGASPGAYARAARALSEIVATQLLASWPAAATSTRR